jgi:hypothetical protein
METYQQIHDFTPAGAARFKVFLAETASSGTSAKICQMECLGGIEDKLNGDSEGLLSWVLGALNSVTGQPVTFTADPADLIIETVKPNE